MIITFLTLRINGGSKDKALVLLQDVLAETRAFPGCLSIELIEDSDDSEQIHLLERWESSDALDRYRQFRIAGPGAVPLVELSKLQLSAPKRVNGSIRTDV